MEGVDRLNELNDEMLVYNIMSRLDCTTKELIRTTATISKRWKNLWTSLPRLIFSGEDDNANYMTGLHGYISFIENTLNQCPTNLNLKKFKLDIDYSSLVNSEFISRANSWIRYAISRNVEEVDLRLPDFGGERFWFSYDDELFFNSSCFNRVKLSWCLFDPPNGAISWERLECLCLSFAILDEDMIEKILSGSPCLESLELNHCYGYGRIDITSKSVKKLVFFTYYSNPALHFVDSIKINAPYISSLTIKGELVLRELVLLNVSSLVEVDLDCIKYQNPKLVMEGVDRLNQLSDELLVNNILSRLDCTTKEVIKTTATISTRWKNLWTSLPHLIFSYEDDITDYDLLGYISFIDNTLNQCPANLNLKKFKLYIQYSGFVKSEFISGANSWIRYAISRNVEEVDLELSYLRVGEEFMFSYDDELFFNNLCFNRVKLSCCVLNPPNGAISWERLKCLCLSRAILDEDMIEKILSGSPCLESLELNECCGYRRIDVTSKSVKKLVFFEYYYDAASDEDYLDCIKINAPYISSLTIKGELVLRELVLLNVSSLVEVDLDYSINCGRFAIFEEEVFKGLLESLGHVKDITFGDHCSELLSRLKAGSDTVDDDRDENGD